MTKRFTILLVGARRPDQIPYKEAWSVIDTGWAGTSSNEYPKPACVINLSREQAEQVAEIFNAAWKEFNQDPW